MTLWKSLKQPTPRKGKEFHHQQNTHFQWNKFGRKSIQANRNATAQGKKERVVVFTGQPLFGLSKIEKGTVLKGADDCSPRIKRQLLPKVSPRVTDIPADGPSFFSRSATDREKYRKHLLEVQQSCSFMCKQTEKAKKETKIWKIPGTFHS